MVWLLVARLALGGTSLDIVPRVSQYAFPRRDECAAVAAEVSRRTGLRVGCRAFVVLRPGRSS